MNSINGFFGEFRWLSNFWTEEDGSCVELEYQRSKCENKEDFCRFDNLSPGQAKRLGRKVEIRKDWDDVKLEIMYLLVKQKFIDSKDLRNKLLATGDVILEETNTWGDIFWGVCNGKGENHLGKILMRVRRELQLIAKNS